MPEIDSNQARKFALTVVEKLRAAGYEALWAGGCVRDALLGREPKDYDVATSARPDQIRQVFGRRRTLAIGAAFGVITVVGRREQGQVEVATFREDATYSDGRHPDRVTFSTAKEDAQRRDFTINGLFFDPVDEQVIDHVGGVKDLRHGVIQAIGDPRKRLEEDKLRMLRAVRFAATYGFELEHKTRESIRENAPELGLVSAERIAGELRRMLAHPSRAQAVELLDATRLLVEILPEAEELGPPQGEAWQQTLVALDALGSADFTLSLAMLCRRIPFETDEGVLVACRRWKLSKDEALGTAWLLANEALACEAHERPWPEVQRVLIDRRAGQLVRLAEASVKVEERDPHGVDFCRQKLALPQDELDPPQLINGDDLRAAGIPPGKAYRQLLTAVRDAQLEGRVTTAEDALELAKQHFKETAG